METLKPCVCGNDFLLTEQLKPTKRVYACKIRCRECGRNSWGVGLTPQEAKETAKRRWNEGEVINI